MKETFFNEAGHVPDVEALLNELSAKNAQVLSFKAKLEVCEKELKQFTGEYNARNQFAKEMRQQYCAFRDCGFDRDQAMSLILTIVDASIRKK